MGMNHTVHNARINLLANLLNAMASSSFTVGVAAPVAAAFFYNSAGLQPLAVALGAAIWIGIATIATCLGATRIGKAACMTDLELFAFVILPIGVGLLGAIAAWAARFIP